MRDLLSDSGIHKAALEVLESKIAVHCNPAEGKVTILPDKTAQFSKTIPLHKLQHDEGDKRLVDLMEIIAHGINRQCYSASFPGEIPKGLTYAEVLVGKKVYLRMAVYYEITLDEFIARFDVIMFEPQNNSTEVAA